MKDRIKELRKVLDLSQAEFSKKIGQYSQTCVSQLEKGTRPISERHIMQICQTFNVNEDWLRNGNPPMFVEVSTPEDRDIAERYLIKRISDLPEDLQTEVLNFCRRILEGVESKKNGINLQNEDSPQSPFEEEAEDSDSAPTADPPHRLAAG